MNFVKLRIFKVWKDSELFIIIEFILIIFKTFQVFVVCVLLFRSNNSQRNSYYLYLMNYLNMLLFQDNKLDTEF